MAISANSIIHYTEKFDTLKSIISESGFKIKYCSEKVVTRGNKSYSLGIAMVSFCDIPLSEYKKHFKNQSTNKLGYYGDYGIGLSKEWAVNKGLNPVLYIDKKSSVGTALRKTIDLYMGTGKSESETHFNIKAFQQDEFAQFACYSKNYQGDLYRHDKLVKRKYRFYDEREWRYVPQPDDIGKRRVILKNKEYSANKDAFNVGVSSYRLKFSLSDISYIIIKDNSELDDLIKVILNNVKETDPEFRLMLTKIITSDQILNDF